MNVRDELYAIAREHLRNVSRSGPSDVRATCPFHSLGNEVTMTLSFSLDKGLFWCFSCGAKGNLRQFLERMEVSPFDINHGPPSYLIAELQRTHPYEEKNPAHKFWGEELVPEGLLGLFSTHPPMQLIDDGFDPELLATYDVGYDKHFERITFALRDIDGNLVGISGRATRKDQKPRYKVYTKELSFYGIPPAKCDKSHLIYNGHRIFPALYDIKRPSVILVEGFKACIWVEQAGFPNVLALLGSKLSFEQQLLLEMLGGEYVLFFDNDPAGLQCTEHVARTLRAPCRVAALPPDIKQPTDLGKEEVGEVLRQAEDSVPWILGRSHVQQTHEALVRATVPSDARAGSAGAGAGPRPGGAARRQVRQR
jgi:DNA primase